MTDFAGGDKLEEAEEARNRRLRLPSVSVPTAGVPGTLPFTGNSVLVELVVALAALAVGGALILFKRLRLRLT